MLGRPGVRVTFELEGARTTIEPVADICPPSWQPEAAQFAAACANALWLAAFLGLDVNMEIDPLLILAQASRLRTLRGILDPRAEIPEVRVLRVDSTAVGIERGAVVVCPGAIFDKMVVVVCVGLVGKLEYEQVGATVKIVAPRVSILSSHCVPRTEWDATIGIGMIANGVAKLESEGLAVVTIDELSDETLERGAAQSKID